MNILNLFRAFSAKIDSFKINRIKKSMQSCGKGVQIFAPYSIAGVSNIILEDYVRIMPKCTLLVTGCKLIIKKYTAISYNFTVVTANHRPTVGIPNYFNNTLHINDQTKGDIVIEEDCWLGVNVTLLPGAHIGRGAIIGANSMINKEIPPYAVAVGSPAKIIGVKFSKEMILNHEIKIYSSSERFSKDYLDELFESYYQGKKVIGTYDISENELDSYKKLLSKLEANLTY